MNKFETQYTLHSIPCTDSEGEHRVSYAQWGDLSGDVIVAVHGLTGNGTDFDYLASALFPHGYSMISIDLPGRGRSDFLTNPMDYNYEQYLNDITAVLEHSSLMTPERVIWLGVSLGGLLGMAMCARSNHPIKALILNDVGPSVPQAALDFIASIIRVPYEFDDLAALEKRMRETRGLTWGPLTDEQWQHMAYWNSRTLDNDKVSYAYDPNISKVFDEYPIGSQDLWEIWPRITYPALLIRGAQTMILPLEMVDRMTSEKTGALLDFVEFPDCGHVPSLAAPEHIQILQTWLEKISK